ncbi:hypothetical protein LLG95_03095 [bacterium]|nr:hypothetical protein [bacterium]
MDGTITPAAGKHVLGRGNPKELGADRVGMYPYSGKVWPPTDFVAEYATVLSGHEQALLRRHAVALADAPAVMSLPAELTHCLARSPESESAIPAMVIKRSGGRSAFWPERKLKFKGCRPVLDGATYPLEVLAPGSHCIEHTAIPFGTLGPEGVMREVLAWAFCREHGLPVHAIPVLVFEYIVDGRSVGCCLISETCGEERIEAHIEYPRCTVQDLIEAKRKGTASVGGVPIGSELQLRDLNLWQYVEDKSRLLCDMHFQGGFRGILNSNIGNDVLQRVSNEYFKLCLCDFDSFRIVRIPDRPCQDFLNDFVLRTMIEVIKGSLSICDYVVIPEAANVSETAEKLGTAYFAKSSLWHAYSRRFGNAAKAGGWDMKCVYEAFVRAKRTEAAAEVLASCVINSHYLRRMSGDRNVFYPHN